MLTSYNLKMPKAVYSGEHALDQIRTVVKGARKIAVFSDKGIVGAGLLEHPLSILKETGAEVVVIDDLPTEPTCDQAQ